VTIKKNTFLIVSGLVYLIGYESCSKVSSSEHENKIVNVRSCTSITETEFPVICFDSLITESRCPNGVACPWIGYASVKLSIKNGTGVTQSFSLSTLAGAHPPTPPNDTTINGYSVKLMNVFPYPDILALPHPDAFKVELQITY
jgi:hypothetical protein